MTVLIIEGSDLSGKGFLIEKIGNDNVLFEIKPQPNGIGRPSIEIYKRIEKI